MTTEDIAREIFIRLIADDINNPNYTEMSLHAGEMEVPIAEVAAQRAFQAAEIFVAAAKERDHGPR